MINCIFLIKSVFFKLFILSNFSVKLQKNTREGHYITFSSDIAHGSIE